MADRLMMFILCLRIHLFEYEDCVYVMSDEGINLMPDDIFITQMANNSYAFTFPKQQPNSLRLLAATTLAYLADSLFYRLDLITGKAEALYHPEGRTYQAFASLPKRATFVLADYGKQSNLYFCFPETAKNFQIRNVCPLQILAIELSLDGKYLAIACGSPTFKLLIVSLEEKRVISGSHNFIDIKSKAGQLVKVQFNPSNRKILSLFFKDCIHIYEIKQTVEVSQGEIVNGIMLNFKHQIDCPQLESCCWDQIGNIYVSGENKLRIVSSENGKELASYDIEAEEEELYIKSLQLTQRHIIVFYNTGRIEWLIKFYPELLQDDSPVKPFQVDKFYANNRKILHGMYDHQFKHLLIAYEDGFLGFLVIQAETNEPQEDYDEDSKNKGKESKKLQLQGSLIGPYHRNKIVMIRQIQGTSLIVSISIDGRVILWSAKQRRQLGFFNLEGQIVCADVNSKSNVLAVGRADGLVQFYSIASFNNHFLFKEFRLTKGKPIDQLAFSSTSQQLAVLSKSQDRVYYVLTNLTMAFEILGYVNLSHKPIRIAWNKTQKTAIKAKHQHLLVVIGYGVLMVNGPAAVPAKRKGEELDLQVEIYALRTDLDQQLVGSLPTGEIITTGSDTFIKKYRQPEEHLAKIDFKTKTAIPPPLEEIEAHDLRINHWQANGKWVVTSALDGTVQIREIGSLQQAKSYKAGGWKQESISCVSCLKSGSTLVGGVNGCLQVWQNQSQVASDEHKVQQLEFKRIVIRETKYFQLMIEEEYLQRMREVINGKKKVQLERLSKIKEELNALLAENEKHDELERLTRDSFAIDLESRDKVAHQGREKCLKIREESRFKILRNEILAKKLKQITWDRMEVQLKAINGLKNNFIAYNYQLRKISREEKRTLQIIFNLRRNQKKQLKKRDQELNYEIYNNKNVVNGGVLQPLILTTIVEKKEEKKEEKNKKKKEEEVASQVQAAEEIFNEEEWGLLYNAFELYSDNAKRNQIIIMKSMILRIKETFNKEFEKILKLRQTQNQLINDKNKRIEEICEELKRPNEAIKSRKNILESNESVLEVKPNQIAFSRYLSKEEREKAQKQRLKEEERLRKLAQDDSSQRALSKMMGGTLEQKKISVLQVTVDRQKWMDKPLQEMNEQQKFKLKQYEQRRQKAQQQKQRIVKKLQAQLRKLKTQIDDIMQKYDEKLFGLVKRKLQYDYRIEEQELYCTRLYLSTSIVRQQQHHQLALTNQIAHQHSQIQNQSQDKEALLQQEQELEKAKEAKHASLQARKLGDIESKIKTIEKSIFQDYGANIKKKRQMEEKLLQAEPSYKRLIIKLDPFREIESKNLSFEKAKEFPFFLNQIKVLQQTYDIPEASLLQILQSRFNIRKEESDLQNKIRHLRDTLGVLEQRQQRNSEIIQREQEQLNVINEFLIKSESDLEIQCRIKQGQVELSNEKPVPELSLALLISRSEIQEKNSKIMVNANEKIRVMEQIKTCKISVTEETLNLQKKQELINKLNSMIKQIQMLKVKKEMQVALSKKDTKINENQIKSLKEQIEKVRKEGEKRIALFEKKIDKITAEIQTIKKQNKQLETQKWNLQVTVKQREKIKEMMVGENGEGDQQAKQKFEQIAINRKLFDKAKQQTEEIELLREELSKLKAKTFANFSNAQR